MICYIRTVMVEAFGRSVLWNPTIESSTCYSRLPDFGHREESPDSIGRDVPAKAGKPSAISEGMDSATENIPP